MTAALPTESAIDAGEEFDRQVATYLEKGFAEAAGISVATFRRRVRPLRALVTERTWSEATPDRVPFVLVPDGVPAEGWITLTTLGGRSGVLQKHFPDASSFAPVDWLAIPSGQAYVLVEVDRGAEFCSVPPDGSVPVITARERTPLTVAEGLALVTVHEQVLEKNRCFSLAGSRCGDKRVPAIWISQKAPTLGWCWAGNPHTWLGTAHAGSRLGL